MPISKPSEQNLFNYSGKYDAPCIDCVLLCIDAPCRDYLQLGGGAKVVTTRLCVAVAALAIHGLPNRWRSPVQDLVNLLQTDVQRLGVNVLPTFLELLTIVPEEFATMVMPSTRRAVVRNGLEESLGLVLQVLGHVLSEETKMASEAVRQAIKCLHAWVQFGVPKEVTEGLFDRLLSKVASGDEDVFEPALDALTAVVTHPNSHSQPVTTKKLAPKLLSLEPLLDKLMAEENFDTATPLAGLFIAFGETHSRLMLDWTMESEEGTMTSSRVVAIVLRISSCKAQFPTQETLSEIPFGFWYIFQDDIIACEPQQYQRCVGVFGSAYHQLVDAMLKKSMYPLNDADWTSDQREAFRCYRTDVADTIMYCHNILRHDLLKLLNDRLDEAMTMTKANATASWPYLETCLYAWSAIGESMAEEEENDLLVQFLTKLPTIPYGDNVKVISSALDCIGGFAEWLAFYPSLVANLVPVVTAAVSVPELSLSATMALKDMARDCGEALKPAAKSIVDSCFAALRSDRLKQGECVRLMYPIGKMISLGPTENVLPGLEPILTPFFVELQTLSQQGQSAQARSRILYILKVLTTLFQALCLGNSNRKQPKQQQLEATAQDPATVLVPQILPLLKAVGDKWIDDEDIMDSTWMLIKQTSGALVDRQSHGVVLQVLEFTASCYAVKPYSGAVELAHHLLVLTSAQANPNAEVRQFLVGLFARMSARTMQYLQTAQNPSDCADLVATFFQTMAQILKKHAAGFFSAQGNGVDAAPLCRAAAFCLALPETRAVKYASLFLAHLIAASADHPAQLAHALDGEFVFRQTLMCVSEEKCRTHAEYYADVIFALSKKQFEALCRWLDAFSKEDGFPNGNVSREEKTQFATHLLRERANKRKVLDLVQEFALVCVGIKN